MAEKKTCEEPKERIHEMQDHVKDSGNREYKSRLFSFIFGREENKRWTLSLYNAIHHTSHDNIDDITINTIEDVVYMGMKNDLSILVSEVVTLYRSMELYEQQSSYNPNMPVREFMYAGKLYDKFIHSAKMNRYGKTLLPLPLPKLVVFYNGEYEKEDEVILSLGDAFKEEIRQNVLRRNSEKEEEMDEAGVAAEVERIFREASPDIEVKVRMVNINHGHNRELLAACRPLGEYAWFVAQVRGNLAAGRSNGNDNPPGIGSAIDKAIDEMPDDFEIKKFILANRSEVKDMCLTEYDEIETMEMLRQEGIQEGMQKGIQKGMQEGIQKGIQKGMQEGIQKGMQEGMKKGMQKGKNETRLLDIKNLMDCMGWTAEKAMDALRIPVIQRPDLYAGLSKNI